VNVQTLTANIRALPDRTRHIVAGAVAWHMAIDGDPEWHPLWDMARDHGRHYEWPTRGDFCAGLSLVGLPFRMVQSMAATYESYDRNTKTADGRK